MMIRFPGGRSAARRSQTLVTPADLRPTLLDWWSIDSRGPATFGKSLMPIIRGESSSVRDRLLLGSLGAQTAIRTPAWYMRLTDPAELFVKPDDRWEINDVADRCHDVVDRLREVWPGVRIHVRGDSGFGVPVMYETCEQLELHYTLGIGMNARLKQMSENTLKTAVNRFEATGQPQRLFCGFWYRAKSWPVRRWVVVKCEANAHGTNRRATSPTRSTRLRHQLTRGTIPPSAPRRSYPSLGGKGAVCPHRCPTARISPRDAPTS